MEILPQKIDPTQPSPPHVGLPLDRPQGGGAWGVGGKGVNPSCVSCPTGYRILDTYLYIYIQPNIRKVLISMSSYINIFP